MFKIVVKGSAADLIKAAFQHGIVEIMNPERSANVAYTHAVVEADEATLAKWFTQDETTNPFPKGSLMFYREH